METKTTFGAINSPTPKWATYLFRAVLYIASLGSIAIASLTILDRYLTPEDKNDINGVFAFIVIAVHLFTRAFGLKEIDPNDFKNK